MTSIIQRLSSGVPTTEQRFKAGAFRSPLPARSGERIKVRGPSDCILTAKRERQEAVATDSRLRSEQNGCFPLAQPGQRLHPSEVNNSNKAVCVSALCNLTGSAPAPRKFIAIRQARPNQMPRSCLTCKRVRTCGRDFFRRVVGFLRQHPERQRGLCSIRELS